MRRFWSRLILPAFLSLVPMSALVAGLLHSRGDVDTGAGESVSALTGREQNEAPPIVHMRVAAEKPEADDSTAEEPQEHAFRPSEEEIARVRAERCADRAIRMYEAAMVSVDDCTEPVRLTLEDLMIIVAPVHRSTPPGSISARVTIRRGDLPPFTVRPAPSAWGHSVTVGRLDPSGERYVMIQGYTNGIHCCVSVELALPDVAHRDLVRIGLFQAGHEVRMDDPAPADVDGDGRADFVAPDNRFFYEFDGFAGTHPPPPRIWNIRDGQAVEVSHAPRYRHLFVGPAAAARRACLEPREHDAVRSACATHVASAARLGEFDRAWAEISRSIGPKHGDMWGNPFLSHLHQFLGVNGYRGPVSRNERDDFAHDIRFPGQSE